jgi:tripartite-type tricarboxylate transporter receptor subunit TctC
VNRNIFLKTLAATGLAAFALGATAQDREPIRLISGFAPGGTTDTIARVMAEHLAQELGQQVIVDNRAGAGGRIGAEYVKNSRPDGKTYLIGPDGWAIFPTAMYSPATLRYDLMKDLKPVAQLVSYPLALVVNGKVPARNLVEYAAWLKKNPKQGQFATPAPGGQVQFVGWVVGEALGTPLLPVAYKGNAPLLTDLIGEQVPAAILVAGDALRQSRDKVRILGVMADERWSLAPDVPTFKEQGYKIKVSEAWQGMWANAAAPKAETDRMEAAVRKVLQKPELQQAIIKMAMVTPKFVSGAQMESSLRSDIDYWAKVVKASGYTPQ